MSHRAAANTGKRHVSAASIDTNASGLAESAISFSSFPEPPSSIPSTPARSTFSARTGGSSPLRQSPVPVPPFRPLQPNRKKKKSSLAHSPITAVDNPVSSRSFSQHDWHEGASSIDVDATEDRMLSTSFITSLLQESSRSDSASAHRHSVNSDAFSAFSEMTYPPPSRHFISASPTQSSPKSPSHAYPSNRPLGSRPPPSSFTPVKEDFRPSKDSGHSANSTVDSELWVPGISQGAPLTSIQSPASIGGSSPHHEEDERLVGEDSNHSSHPEAPQSFLHNLTTANSDQSRQSFHSTKSVATSVISRISARVARALPWRTAKPLPPIPPLPNRIPMRTESADHQLTVSQLAARADALNEVLEKGLHPRQTIGSQYSFDKEEDVRTPGITPWRGGDNWNRPMQPVGFSQYESGNEKLETKELKMKGLSISNVKANRKRYCLLLGVFILIAGAVVGAGVGVSVTRKGPTLPKCTGSLTGMACDLDATCVCTSSIDSGNCNPLPQAIIDTISDMNVAFGVNYTVTSAYSTLWQAHTVTSSSSCVSQALLIDTAPSIRLADAPARTAWARQALLWNLLQSQDAKAVHSLQEGIKNLPWLSIAADGVVEDKLNVFGVSASGFIFNFASQTISQASITFTSNGQPLDDQNKRVGPTAMTALNRMYSVAFASSSQRQSALSSYWASVLQQRPEDLPLFKSAIISSSILLPFDGTSQDMVSLMTDNSGSPFPPPLSCYPSLNSNVATLVNRVEQDVFGLPSATQASRFDTSCFSDRPIYGVLDVLRLRLPFIDSQTGAAKQAVVLRPEVNSRAILHVGDILSPFPQSTNSTPFILNPREHGTVNNVNHIIFNYLTSIRDINLAISVVQFILLAASRGLPPTSNSTVAKFLSAIPPIEVAVFGSVIGADISSIVSSLSTPSGSLYFGSTQASSVRNYGIKTLSGGGVRWTESAVASEIARDTSFDDGTFNDIWKAAATALETKAENVGVKNVTDSLRSTGKLSAIP